MARTGPPAAALGAAEVLHSGRREQPSPVALAAGWKVSASVIIARHLSAYQSSRYVAPADVAAIKRHSAWFDVAGK